MKSTRRHELQHNVLDAELARFVTFLKERGTQIFYVVLVLAVVGAIAWFSYSRSRNRAAQVRTRYDSLVRFQRMPEKQSEVLAGFQELADQDSVERIAADACVRAGDMFAAKALDSSLPTERKEFADQAGRYYRRAIDQHGSIRNVLAKARLGLARLAESERDYDAARKEYEAVVAMKELSEYPAVKLALVGLERMPKLKAPVPMATTLPTQPAREEEVSPATMPSSGAEGE